MTRLRRTCFAAATLLGALGLSLAAGEWVLRSQAERIRASDRMDDGLLEYDADLGWRLARRWEGRHLHHDFEVTYRTDSEGRREAEGPADGPAVAFLGDSFTFGLGVDQGETFVERWAARQAPPARALNFGVPGTSTDQQVLLLERRVLALRPDLVVIVVCLVNDLFDNVRPVPLQAPYAKPYFELGADGLVLRNVPVPRGPAPSRAAEADLATLVLPPDRLRPSGLRAWLGRLELSRRLGLFQPRTELPPGHLEGRYAGELVVFGALVERADRATRAAGARLALALLPGRSFVEEPGSWSEQYQGFLRRALLERVQALRVPVVDLGEPLRRARLAGGGPSYHPNEGHLNAAGHGRVADALATTLPWPAERPSR